MTWEMTQSGIFQFSLKRDMDTHSMSKRRHFGTFCLTLLYNFPALVYRSVESVALIACLTKIHTYHDWLLDGTVPLYRTLTRVWRARWFQFHPCRLAVPQRVWTVELLSTLTRIQHSRVLYTYGLVVDDGGRNDGNSNKLSPAGAAIQANVCAMNACKRRTSK